MVRENLDKTFELPKKKEKLSFREKRIKEQSNVINKARPGDIITYQDNTKYMITAEGTFVNIGKHQIPKLSKKERRRLQKQQRKERIS